MVGIIGHGAYIPRYRIKAEEYVRVWGNFAPGIEEKTVCGYDEDTTTMAIEAADNAISRAQIDPEKIKMVYFATTSSPYVEKLSSSTIATAVGAGQDVRTADFAGSTKSGTEALLACFDAISEYGLVVASDFPVGAPDDDNEHAYGAGAAAFVIGDGNPVVTLEKSYSVSGEVLGERFRKVGEIYIQDLGLRTSQFPIFIRRSLKGLIKELGEVEINHVILQQPDGEAFRAVREFKFTDIQLRGGLVAQTGDTGAASVLLSLANVLDQAKPGERILIASYGSGAGSDSLSLVVHDEVEKMGEKPTVKEQLEEKEYIDYVTYLKFRKVLSTFGGDK